MFSKEAYINFLRTLLDKGYKFQSFTDVLHHKGIIVLRHDIDLSVKKAFEIALIETDFGIKSTFFFLCRHHVYNPFTKKNSKLIEKIHTIGHTVSIHFDPTLYKNPIEGLILEKKLWEMFFSIPVKVISIHKPLPYFVGNDIFSEIGVISTYKKEFMEYPLKYFSDSNRNFREGNPINSEYFENFHSMQILIHPVWWMSKGNNIIDNLLEIKEEHMIALDEYLINTIGGYREWKKKR